VKVIPDPAFSLQALSEEARWSIITGNQSENRRFAAGILRICDPDENEYNWVNVIYPTYQPVDLKQYEILGFHQQTDLLTTTITPVASDIDPKSTINELTDAEVDAAINALPHLKNLNLANASGHTTPAQHMQIKRVVLKHHKLWDTSPKVSPPDATVCDVKVRAGERFTGQGRHIPTNPATRVILLNLIEDKL
jgi:hypothetical protein